MTCNLSLYECLQQVSLESYHGKLEDRGITDVSGLLSLTMQDYPALGISSMADRQNLFYLIQTIKAMHRPFSQERRLRSAAKNDGLLGAEDSAGKQKDRKSGTKRPREPAENSPVAVKIKTKAQEKISGSARLSSISRSSEHENSPRFYDYGVPSYKPKRSPGKSHQSELGPSRIQVCVRKRPLSEAEINNNEVDVVTVTSNKTIELIAPKVAVDLTKFTQKYQFIFDEVFDEDCSNNKIFERTARPLIKTVFNRGRATCFAYGCTGSGKTFTMLGNEEVPGIYILAAKEIFTSFHNRTYGDGLGLWISFYEIYCGQLFDLLNGRERLFAREDANHQVCIAGLTDRHVHNVEELMEIIEYGEQVRSTGATGVNADSSRSHAILQLEVKVVGTAEHVGRFSFIDLAGCERAADVTDTDKQTRVEGAEINQSLLALKECIRALDLDSKHTPFRQSKLTQVLKDSFVGNSQTCMIANISPNASCSENTLNTLRYADRVKELRKDTPVTPIGPRPVTVPAVLPQLDQLLAVNRTKQLAKVGMQSPKETKPSYQLKGSLQKTKTVSMDSDGFLRPKTSTTTALSPRTKESVTLRRAMGNSLNENKQLLVQPCIQRPQTSPDVMTCKGHLLGNRVQTRSRTSSKCSADHSVKMKSMKTLVERPEERPAVDQHMCEENNNMEDKLFVSANLVVSKTLNDATRPGSCTEQDLTQTESRNRIVHADEQIKDTSLPSRNNDRYGYGIKTRLAKLFNKGNTCMEEPKVNEPVHFPMTLESEEKPPHLSPTQEHFVASHHTQLSLVTGLCHEEMVLLKQVSSGQKDFQDYMEQLDEILSRKAACIQSLRDTLSKCQA